MGSIRQLSEELIKKIAAGEVIDRPASVVKELVENSIDAGATKIEIEIERAGKYIKVSDNGMGISPSDTELLFARHATSKIKYFDDLWRVSSLGFRGEALSSISAVSKITCRTKHIDEEYGFELKLVDGKIQKKSSAVSIGTIFEIDDLFYNVPARQKFLKSEVTETGHIYEVINSLALSYPKTAFKLLSNKNIVLQTTASGGLRQAILELLGEDLKDKLIEVSAKNHFVDLTGFVSALEVYRSDRKSMFYFINNRPVKCQILSKAINSAFEGLLPGGKYPVIVLNFKFKPTYVDVNVHPSKKEVRYIHPNDVYNLTLHAMQDTVSEHYKKEYKEKSVYSMPVLTESKSVLKEDAILNKPSRNKSYTEAAFKFYTPLPDAICVSDNLERIDNKETVTAESIAITELPLFSISSLKTKVIVLDKPIANITRIANKTIFEVGTIFDQNVQIVFSGEITGNPDYQKSFFNSLSELGNEIYKTYSTSNNLPIQKRLINSTLEDAGTVKSKSRKKPPESTLYKIWDRDNWTCVYCKKQLIDPKVVKSAIKDAKDAFITYINVDGKEVTNHLLQEHLASYDHYLPVSKLPQYNFDYENLFSSCCECNRKKSDSMNLKAWQPEMSNSWEKPLEVAGLQFTNPKTYSELSKIFSK